MLAASAPPSSEGLRPEMLTMSERLLAAVVDLLAGANWQRSGGRGPKPRYLLSPPDDEGATVVGRGAGPGADQDAVRARLRARGRGR